MGLDCVANVAVDLQSLRKRERLWSGLQEWENHMATMPKEREESQCCAILVKALLASRDCLVGVRVFS